MSGTDTAASGAAARASIRARSRKSKGGAAQRECQRVPRRGAGQTTEAVPPAGAVDERVIVDRYQHGQLRVDAAQQRPQVVVLPEEGVEAPVHPDLDAAVLLGPAADAPAQILLAFDDVDADSAFGQTRGGGQTGDSGTDNDGARSRRQRVGAGQAPRCRVRPATPIGHRGASPRKVCTMLVSQPGMVSLCTAVNPASRSRCRNCVAPSNVSTLRHR